VRIVVCVKHVPDIQSERALGPDGRLVRDGGDGTINELDENAVEAAVVLAEQTRDAGGDAEVVVVTVGPDDAEDAVRRGLQLGADAAVHVLDDGVAGSDVFGTAAVLAAVVRRLGADGPVDLVVTGMAGLDGLTSLLPAALAALLDLPQLTLAASVALDATDGGVVTVRRDLDHATEVLTAPLPALVSVTDRANEPRYPNFQGIMAARKKPVTTLTLADLGVDPAEVGAAGARTEVVEAAPRPPRTDRVLVTDDGEAGTRLAAWLVERDLVRTTPATGEVL
jgi:electron transfer flavoprotein beta subunit